MIDRHILNELGTLNSITMINESYVAFCSKLDLYSKAIIYDFKKHKIVAEYKSEKNCQLVFYRTNKEDFFIYYNQKQNGQEEPEEKTVMTLETAEKFAKIDSIRDLDTNDHKMLEKVGPLLDELSNSQEVHEFSPPVYFYVPNAPIFLINTKTFTSETKNVGWVGDNAISVNKERIYIDRPWKSSIKDKDFVSATSIQYNFNASIKQAGTDNFFHLSYDIFDEMNRTWSDLPLFNIEYRIKNSHSYQSESHRKFRGLLISGCSIGNNHLIFGCHTPLSGYSKRSKPFTIGIWDEQSPKNFKKTIQLDHDISKLLYIPEKKLIVGLVSADSSFFYIFDKNLNYKIIKTKKSIADIAIFDHGNNKIAFMDGTVNDLEMYINPDYYVKYNKKIKEVLEEKIPAVIIPIINDYAGSKNCFSLFNKPKPSIDEIELPHRHPATNCKIL